MEPISSVDWKNAQGYVNVLKPFHEATKVEEGETSVTLSSVIPVIGILHEKTTAYYKSHLNHGFGITFAKNITASVEDRFGKYPKFFLKMPHCLATFSDPRFARVYFRKKPGMDEVTETVLEVVKDEIERIELGDGETPRSPLEVEQSCAHGVDSFWDKFDEQADKQSDTSLSLDAEIQKWSCLKPPARTCNAIHAMDTLKKDFSRIFRLFRKFAAFPATQNKDERLFSMIGRTTGSLCQSIKVETIEKKVVVGSAIQKHGFRFHYKDGHEISSDESFE